MIWKFQSGYLKISQSDSVSSFLECYLSLPPNKIDCNAMTQSLVDKKTDHQAFKIKGTWRSHAGKTITWFTFLDPDKRFKLPSLPRNQPLLGIFWGGRGTKIIRKLCHKTMTPCAATISENPKKRLGTRQLPFKAQRALLPSVNNRTLTNITLTTKYLRCFVQVFLCNIRAGNCLFLFRFTCALYLAPLKL